MNTVKTINVKEIGDIKLPWLKNKRLRRLLKANKNKFLYRLYKIRIRQDPKTPVPNILIFSSARSGSTWLAENLARISNKDIAFEPLIHYAKGIEKRPSIENIYSSDLTHDELTRILYLQKLSPWICSKSILNIINDSDELIIKFIRGNWLISDIILQYELKYKPILLVRDPYTVIESIRRSFKIENYHELIKADYATLPLTEKQQEIVNSVKTNLQALAVKWYLDNQVILDNPEIKQKIISIQYEDLIKNPNQVFQNLSKELGLSFDYTKLKLQKPSQTASKNHKQNIRLTDEEVNEIHEIFERFNE